MRHFVHGNDGNKYGPADLATLQQWKVEGRLTPETMLEPEVGGAAFPARDVPGLFVAPAPQPGPYEPGGPQYASYPYVPPQPQNVQNFAIAGWILAVVSLCVCWPILGPLSIYFAYKANSGGYQYGKALITTAVVCTLLGAFFGILAVFSMMGGGMFR